MCLKYDRLMILVMNIKCTRPQFFRLLHSLSDSKPLSQNEFCAVLSFFESFSAKGVGSKSYNLNHTSYVISIVGTRMMDDV